MLKTTLTMVFTVAGCAALILGYMWLSMGTGLHPMIAGALGAALFFVPFLIWRE